MKTILLTLLSSITFSGLFACSFDVDPFCKTINTNYPESVIVRGAYTETMDNGMVFQIYETLRGAEDREFINIWDNIDFECNGTINRKAEIFGDIGEERILSLESVDSIEQSYEILGDYRVPDDVWMETYALKVNGDIVEGFLVSYDGPYSMSLSDLVSVLIEEGSCTILSSPSLILEDINTYPSITEDNIYLEYSNISATASYDIVNISGQKEISSSLTRTIDLSMLRSGIYFLIVRDGDAVSIPKKLIKL